MSLAGTEKLFGVLDGDVDRPAGGVAFDRLCGRGRDIGGDPSDVVAAAGGGPFPDEADGDRLGAEYCGPPAADGGGVDGGGPAVSVRRLGWRWRRRRAGPGWVADGLSCGAGRVFRCVVG